MPKLTIDQRTKGKAVAALLKLYKAEPEFMRELRELRITYSPVLERFLNIGVPKWIQMKETLTHEEFTFTRDFFLTKNRNISESLANKLETLLPTPDPQLASQLESYEKSLSELAYRWHLKAAWAGLVLLLDHIQDMTINKMPEDVRNAEMPIEILEPFLPSAPLPPLQFEVNANELMFSGRQEMQDKFAKALADYENKLKSSGWQELPTAIENHTRWWFEHYVNNKTYPELERENPQAGGESIKRAVWKFSKLLNIQIK